ncbi:M48 family metalloprotease [Neptuniibacter caesariensis]|uniref:Putative beta-barrel assembly-enhancing protease n=1 Tax=Neptuniibacter caesariensis TaxID=207954 RepID=A0A7U8C2A8_NEPCE|nr:M48 family metalloprotease [Neptuniibacter caesariensis]EAR60143.1 Peptidase family M48 family protein [Oceanospirillum sp. MED92] [Neptuniibacter caesariensis]
MRGLLSAFLITLLMGSSSSALKAESQLPDIGGTGYSVLTLQQEHNLGRAWVRMLRGSSRLYKDALVSQYVEDLTWSLVTHSQLLDKRLEILVLDNPTVNAFAAPGGIIGVHTGLLLTAQNEAQLASVLAHELAHLSQRHFAAQLEEDRRNRPLFIASILGSILLAAADPEAGVVGLHSSFGAATANKLAFSRQNEREADYIGMQTLTSAGYSPNAMGNMFLQLQKQARFSRVPPEFLLTHPVTQSRISDSQSRAAGYKGGTRKLDSIDFNIARARIQANYAKDLKQLLAELDSIQKKRNSDVVKYAISYAAMKDKQFELAETTLKTISKDFSKRLSVRLLKAEIAMAQMNYSSAVKTLSKLMQVYPGNHAVSFTYADALLKMEQPSKASQVYEDLVERNPNDSRAWYLLAESYGLEGNIVGVHEARIEYFLLTANVDRALRQIEFALKDESLSTAERAKFEQRREDAKQVRESLNLDF